MARVKNGAANASMVAGMGGYGCMTYNCIFVKAASVTITAGYGILYYGYGVVEAAETQEASG